MGIFADRESPRSAATAAPGRRCSTGPPEAGSTTTGGRAYLDFFAGAGALNYGHNNPALKAALLDYLAGDRVIHSLDMHTVAKREFLTAFDELILRPRQLDYRVQFPGPGGANAVEAALKLARKATGRTQVITFTNAFHGMTLGALSVTGSSFHRAGAGLPLAHATPMPFDRALDGQMPDFAVARAPADQPRQRSRRPGRRDRGDGPGRGRHPRRPPGVAARPGRPVPTATASCSSSTTCRWAAAAPARSSASRPPASGRTSSACPSPSAASACRSRSP